MCSDKLTKAEVFSLRALLNSMLRDYPNSPNMELSTEWLILKSNEQNIKIEIEKYSLTGSHRYGNELIGTKGEYISFNDFVEFIENLFKTKPHFSYQVIKSRNEIEKNLNLDQSIVEANAFLKSEQTLLLGHPFHPFPKYKGNVEEEQIRRFSPEFKSNFKLVWVSVKEDLLFLEEMSENLRLEKLQDFDLLEKRNDGYKWIPMHPLQHEHLIKSIVKIGEVDTSKMITKIGQNNWSACSSMRTLYCQGAPCFLKFSLPIKLTNSVRILNSSDLKRSNVINKIFETKELTDFFEKNSSFRVQQESTFGGIFLEGQVLDESIFQLRECLYGDENKSFVLATLCEEVGEQSRLRDFSLIKKVKEDIPENYIIKNWFSKMLEVVFRPIISLAFEEGILLGAHLQNLIVGFEEGEPAFVEYRDCQGTGLTCFGKDRFSKYLGEDVLVIDEENANKVFGYYLVVNSIFSVISSLSKNRNDELILIDALREFFWKLRIEMPQGESFFNYWIENKEVYQKGNFRCSIEENDENTMDDPWAIYNKINNPLSLLRKIHSYGFEQLHHKINSKNGKKLSLRKLDIQKDLDIFHKWHNKPYISEFWELNKTKEELRDYITHLYQSSYQLPIIAELDDRPVGYFELYWAFTDRIAPYCKADLHDRGVHVLIGEESILKTRYVYDSLCLIAEFCFKDDPLCNSVWGEPRVDNEKMIKLAQALPGWEALFEFSFPHKKSRLLKCSREIHQKEVQRD